MINHWFGCHCLFSIAGSDDPDIHNVFNSYVVVLAILVESNVVIVVLISQNFSVRFSKKHC